MQLTLTDADPAALDLCRRNVQLNGYRVVKKRDGNSGRVDEDSPTSSSPSSSSQFVHVQSLFWGDDSVATVPAADVVVAADILYDIRMLPAIRTTAVAALQRSQNFSNRVADDDNGGGAPLFFLSHVPRACYNTTTTLDSPEMLDLEGYIIRTLGESGALVHVDTIRPCDLPASVQEDAPDRCLNAIDRHELQAVGAALLVFALATAEAAGAGSLL